MEVPAIKTPAYPVPEHLDDPRLRAIFDYWRSRFRGSLLPARTDIDPIQIPALLGHINIIEVTRRGDAIRFHPTLLDFAGHYRYEPRPVAIARGKSPHKSPSKQAAYNSAAGT